MFSGNICTGKNSNKIQCESKKYTQVPKTFGNIFTQAKYVSVKFCRFIASLYPHIFTNFGRFFSIFNKMALIFLGVLIILPFQVSSFSKSDCLDFIAIDKWPQFICPQSTNLSCLGAMLEYHKLQPKPKTAPQFENALQLIWPALLEKAINSSAKESDCRHVSVLSQQWTF